MKNILMKYRFWFNCWGIVFAILGLVFSFYMTTFYIGNHDFPFMRYGVKITDGVWEGRLTQFVLPYVFLKGQVLPILNSLLGMAFFAGGSVALAFWYHVPQKYLPVVLFSLLIVLNPYVCAQLYYVHTVTSVLCWHLFCIVGVICAWQFTKKYQIRWLLAAVILMWFALAGYAPSLELILVVLCGKFLMDIISGDRIDKSFIKRYGALGLVLILTMLSYATSIYILKQGKIIQTQMYNVQTLPVKGIIELFINEWNAPFKTLAMDMPYVSEFSKYLLLLLVILTLYSAYGKKRLVACIFILVGLFYVAFILAYVSPFGIFKVIRIHSFSVPYVAAVLFAAVMLYGKQFKRNVSLLAVLFLVAIYAKADFTAQKIWYLGTEQDERNVERVRAEIVPKLTAGKHYRLSTVGSFYGRQKFAGVKNLSEEQREVYREYYGYGLYLPIFFSSGFFMYEQDNPVWGNATNFNNYLEYIVVNEYLDSTTEINARIFARSYGDDKEKLIAATDRLCAYPCKNFYYIGQKDILLMVSNDDTNRLVLKWNIENEGKF